jgi:pimeloyl-ACP methyl ester carboxylesterase
LKIARKTPICRAWLLGAPADAPAALFAPSGERPLCRELPSWFLIGDEDRIIPAELQRFTAERAGSQRTVEIPGALPVSQPQATVELILEAATLPAAA